VVVVASVSCIYGIGSKEDYEALVVPVRVGQEISREQFLSRLVDLQYSRNDIAFERGNFRVRGDTVELRPSHMEDGLRFEFFGEEIERITLFDPLTGQKINSRPAFTVYPSKQFATPMDKIKGAVLSIREELTERIAQFEREGKLLEAQRIKMRTEYDLEMMLEMGFCSGIENYSRHLSGRSPGARPCTLFDFFPSDFLLVIDESHATVPQIGGVSATPGPKELEWSKGWVAEQIVRPTGLVDPEIVLRPLKGQIDDLIHEARQRVEQKERVLVTTLTKRTAEELTDYLRDIGINVRYLHSEIDAIERVEILRALRKGEFDVLVGINLLREGLDLPEVSLVAILDADKEGYLRSTTSLIQTAGRAARHLHGQVILYADTKTQSIQKFLATSEYRRQKQLAYNAEHGITPRSVSRAVEESLSTSQSQRDSAVGMLNETSKNFDVSETIRELEQEMLEAANNLEFEKAALLRDQVRELKRMLGEGQSAAGSATPRVSYGKSRGRKRRQAASSG